MAATLLALGITSSAAVVAGARALVPRAAAAYAVVVLAVSDDFAVAVAAYVPATIFLLGVFTAGAWRTGDRRLVAGAAGIGILLVGSWVQWRAVAAPALGLTHNALFHVIEMLALPLIYRGSRSRSNRRSARC